MRPEPALPLADETEQPAIPPLGRGQRLLRFNPMELLFGDSEKRPPVLLAVTPPRTGERTLLGVENLLQSIAVPEPFSLELSSTVDGVVLMARCHQKQAVHGQVMAHYPQARIVEVPPEDDPMRLREGERAWSMSLFAGGPEYVPLRTFRDDDLLDPGSDPMIALLGSLSALRPESASCPACFSVPLALTGPSPTRTRLSRGLWWSRGTRPTPTTPSPCSWMASPWPSWDWGRWES